MLAMFPLHIYAADWLCTEESSQRVENTIQACGIGMSVNEKTARQEAFISAKQEFSNICDSDFGCKNHAVSVKPRRTSCQVESGIYTCYRLIEFTIGEYTGSGDTYADLTSPQNPLNAFWNHWEATYLTH